MRGVVDRVAQTGSWPAASETGSGEFGGSGGSW